MVSYYQNSYLDALVYLEIVWLYYILMFEIKKEYKILITITSVLIMLSTVFIKQHVIVDVLGAFIIVPMYYIIRKKKINLEESGIYAKIFCQKKRTK